MSDITMLSMEQVSEMVKDRKVWRAQRSFNHR